MRFAISFVTLVAAALAAAQPSTRQASLNPPASVVRPEFAAELGTSASSPAPQTNAKRFAAGLPPLAPRAYHRPERRGPHIGTKVDTVPRAVSSPSPPVTVKCNVLVKNAEDGSSFGYLKPTWNIFGEYGLFQSDQSGALEVSFSYSPEDPNSLSQLDLAATNGPGNSFPYVGLTSGWASPSDDIGTGQHNYGYVTGTTQTPKGSPPVEADNNSFGAATGIPEGTESAVWKYDPNTQAITAQWVNTDGTAQTTYLIYANDANNALIFTGDVAAFRDMFDAYPQVTYTCVPPAAVQVPK